LEKKKNDPKTLIDFSVQKPLLLFLSSEFLPYSGEESGNAEFHLNDQVCLENNIGILFILYTFIN